MSPQHTGLGRTFCLAVSLLFRTEEQAKARICPQDPGQSWPMLPKPWTSQVGREAPYGKEPWPSHSHQP